MVVSDDDQSPFYARVYDDAGRLAHEVVTHLDDYADRVPLIVTCDLGVGVEHLAAVREGVGRLGGLGTTDEKLALGVAVLRTHRHQADFERSTPDIRAELKLLEDLLAGLLGEEFGLYCQLRRKQLHLHSFSNL